MHQTAIYEVANHQQRRDIEIIDIKANSVLAKSLEDGEFCYNHKMYDIIKIEKDNEILHTYCIPDHNESILNQVFNNQIDEQTPLASGVKNLIKLLVQDALPIQNKTEIEFFNPVIYAQKYNPAFLNIKKDILSPPPLFI